MKRKICSFVLAISVLTSVMSVSAFATETGKVVSAVPQIDSSLMADTLSEIGFPSAIVETIPLDDAQIVIQAYKNDPSSVSVTSTVTEFDVLSELDTFVNATHDELISMGLTDESIKKTNEVIESYSKMSDEELAEELTLDAVGTKLFKDAITPDENYDVKKTDMDVTASGFVSSTKLTYTQSCSSSNTPNSVKYYVGLYFAWANPEVIIYPGWYDNIVTAWGGNLTQSVNHKYTTYYTVNTNSPTLKWDSYNSTINHYYVETAINAGGYFTFTQGINVTGDDASAKFGSVGFYLSQNANYGLTTKVVSQFAHRELQWGSTSISTSGLNLEIGDGFDTSAQKESVITY